ncbi:MAG: lysophospholipid acyltransferase family protein [Rudaea sp.]
MSTSKRVLPSTTPDKSTEKTNSEQGPLISALRVFVRAGLRAAATCLLRVDAEQIKKIPQEGPLILATNHVNSLDIPVVNGYLGQRRMAVMVKREAWDNPFLALLFGLYGGIPLNRGETDVPAFRQALAVLRQGAILAIAPEGTRTGDGRLRRGHPGIAMVALHSGAPLLPIAIYGFENFTSNLMHLRRTEFHVAVGNSFLVRTDGVNTPREARQQISDEIMYQIAALLPERYRGYYSNLNDATEHYLEFPPNSESNLKTNHALQRTDQGRV